MWALGLLNFASEQIALFHSVLKPVLEDFVKAFDKPESNKLISFWNRIVHREDGGSGPQYLSGWITAFCFWDIGGNMLYNQPPEQPFLGGCNLDGTFFHCVDMRQ